MHCWDLWSAKRLLSSLLQSLINRWAQSQNENHYLCPACRQPFTMIADSKTFPSGYTEREKILESWEKSESMQRCELYQTFGHCNLWGCKRLHAFLRPVGTKILPFDVDNEVAQKLEENDYEWKKMIEAEESVKIFINRTDERFFFRTILITSKVSVDNSERALSRIRTHCLLNRIRSLRNLPGNWEGQKEVLLMVWSAKMTSNVEGLGEGYS